MSALMCVDDVCEGQDDIKRIETSLNALRILMINDN